MFVLNTVF